MGTLLLSLAIAGFAFSVLYYVFVRDLHFPLRSRDCQLHASLDGQARVTQLAFSPDGKTLVSGHVDGNLRWWDVASASELRTYALGSTVTSFAFSADGKYFAAVSQYDGAVRVWDAATGRVAGSIRCGRPVVCVCFSTTGDLLTVCEANDSAYLQVWDVERIHLRHSHSLGPGLGTKIESSPNGRSVVVLHSAELGCSADRMTMFDLDTDERLWSASSPSHFHFQPVFSPNGRALVTVGSDQGIVLWDASDGTVTSSLPFDRRGLCSNVLFAGDATRLMGGVTTYTTTRWTRLKSFLGGSLVEWPRGAVVCWNANTGQMRTIIDDPHPISRVAVNRDATLLATGSQHGTIRIWRLNDDAGSPKHKNGR